MSSIRANNDLGHPICQNLREGNWLMDYTAQRLMPFERTKKVLKSALFSENSLQNRFYFVLKGLPLLLTK